MSLFFDDRTPIRYEADPVPFDMRVRDEALRVSAGVADLLNSLGRRDVARLMRETGFFDNGYLPDWIKDPRYFAPRPGKDNVFAARFDFALHDGRPVLIELNTACPAGHVFYPSVCGLISARGGGRGEVFSSYPKDLFAGLLAARARSLRGRGARVALVTSAVSRITNELGDIRAQVEEKGVSCSVCDIQDITYSRGVPRVNGRRIDLAWCKFTDSHAGRLYGLVDRDPVFLRRLLDAFAGGLLDIANPPLAFYFLEDKAFLGALRRELPPDLAGSVAPTEVVGPGGRLSRGLASGGLVLKPRIGTRADGVVSLDGLSGRARAALLSEVSGGASYVAQRACNNRRPGADGALRVLSVPVYAGRPAAVTGRAARSFPVSVGKGAGIFAFSASVPPLRGEKRSMAGFNGKYFARELFPGYGAGRAAFHADVLRLLDIAAARTSLARVAGKIRYFNARPDVYEENGRRWLLELNIDPGVGPQSHIAYLQERHGIRFLNDAGQKVIPFVESLARLVRDVPGPLAILGSKTDADIFDAADAWLVDKLKQATAARIRFYPAAEWRRLGRLPEPFLVRWLSMCQIRLDAGLSAAYGRLLRSSEDLSPGRYSDIAVSKRVLAELWEAVERGALPAADAAVVRRTVPWSAVLGRRSYRPGRRALSLADIVSAREGFVIKKMHSFRAKDVYIGAELAPGDWRAAVDAALRAGDYIVQRRVDNTLALDAGLEDISGRRSRKNLSYMVSPFVMGRCMAGTFVRAWSRTDPAITFDRKVIGTTGDFIC